MQEGVPASPNPWQIVNVAIFTAVFLLSPIRKGRDSALPNTQASGASSLLETFAAIAFLLLAHLQHIAGDSTLLVEGSLWTFTLQLARMC